MKKRYPQEMLLMSDCPNCGQEVNRDYVRKIIDEILEAHTQHILDEILDKIKINKQLTKEGRDEYFYKGNKLYNIKKITGLNYLWHDLSANWKDKDDNNKEKLGNFYLKDLEFTPENQQNDDK